MYKTILKKIKELENEETGIKSDEDNRQSKIQKYQNELNKIKKMFPKGFFEKD